MGLSGLGDMGDLGKMVGGTVGLAIAAIVLLTFAPQIAGDIDGIAGQAQPHVVMGGERFSRVVDKGTHTTAAEAWASTTYTPLNVVAAGTYTIATGDYFTPKGTAFKVATANTIPGAAGRQPSRSLTALANGSLVSLLFGAMAILLPAGALGFLGYLGAMLVKQNIGGGTLAIAIGATVAVVLIGSLLPEIFEPLDDLYNALDGNRFQVYDEGIGKLGGILGNFLGISLIGGLITLGVMLWKGRDGSNAATGAMV